jgi:AraC-like DNA-binding protein
MVPMTSTFSLPRLPAAADGLLAQMCAAAGIASKGPWTTAEFFRLWAAAETLCDDASAGLRFGADGIASGYSVAGLVALHAPTLRAALAALGRYKRLTCPEIVEVECAGDEARVRYRWLQATGLVPRFLTDMTLASLRELVRQGTTGAVTPRRLELTRRPRDEALLAKHFGCPILFQAPHDAMVFDSSALDARFVTSDAPAFERVLTGVEERLRQGEGFSGSVGEIRVAIARELSEGRAPTITRVARCLRVSPRTLQRRLRHDGTAFQQQLAGVRRTLAQRFLANTELDPVAVAMLLGFAEPNSFARAFRSWERTTPARWRDLNATAAATTGAHP